MSVEWDGPLSVARIAGLIVDLIGKAGTYEPSPVPNWVKETVETGASRGEFLKQCTPGYYNDEGQLDEKTFRSQPYGGGGPTFNKIIGKWREDNKFDGMRVQYGSNKANGELNGLS